MGGGSSALKFDAMLPAQPLRKAAMLGRRAAEAGLSGLVVTEAGRTAYLTCGALAAAADIDVLDRHRRGVPTQPDGHGLGGLGAGRGEQGPVPPRPRGAGAGAHRAALRGRVRSSGTTVARVRAGGERDLPVLPHRRAALGRWRLLLSVAAPTHVVARPDRRLRPAGRHRRGQPLDAAHGRRGRRRRARAPAEHADLSARDGVAGTGGRRGARSGGAWTTSR